MAVKPTSPDNHPISIDANPYAFTFDPRHTALLVIDMQRDFLLAGGFGAVQGGNLKAVQASIKENQKLLTACREAQLAIFHTREGHKPDLSDCPSSKLVRQAAAPGNVHHSLIIGDEGDMGRLLVQGEYGHDIVDELKPLPGEIVIDKPGKGAFFNTSLMHKLKARAITHLIISGVTTECCVATTAREANDRGFETCVIEEATAGYNPDFKCSTLNMLHWSQGLFGFVATLKPLVEALRPRSLTSSPDSMHTPPPTPPVWDGDLRINKLQASYRAGVSPAQVVESLYKKIEAYQKVDPAVWIHLCDKDTVLSAAKALMLRYPDKTALPPLFGVPFSVKDSVDIEGLPTTTACPPLTHVATVSAPVYTKVIKNGGLFLGKTNLDQLATGLVGCRSPYGTPHSVFHQDYISGGSSSGSCVSVGANLVSFSIATDTAGSGRVPASFNGVVGYKPTRGLISFSNIVPACLSLDCVAIISRTVADARTVWQLVEEFDEKDRYAKPTLATERHVNSIGPQSKAFKFGIPPAEVLDICSKPYRRLFSEAVTRIQAIGGTLVPIDWSPFENAGQLLYNGTFVSERLASLPDNFIEERKQDLHPVILKLFEDVIARKSTAVQAYRDLQDKALYTRQAERVFVPGKDGIDTLVVPTAPTHWTIVQVLEDPIRKNSVLGHFTHSGNVLDLCGVAVPAGTYPAAELSGENEDQGFLPFGITFLGGSRMDAEVLEIARRFEDSGRQ